MQTRPTKHTLTFKFEVVTDGQRQFDIETLDQAINDYVEEAAVSGQVTELITEEVKNDLWSYVSTDDVYGNFKVELKELKSVQSDDDNNEQVGA